MSSKVFFSKEEVESHFAREKELLTKRYMQEMENLSKAESEEKIHRQPSEPFDEICLREKKSGKIIKVQVPKTNYKLVDIKKTFKGNGIGNTDGIIYFKAEENAQNLLESSYDIVTKLLTQAQKLHNLPHERKDVDTEENDGCLSYTLKLPEGNFWINCKEWCEVGGVNWSDYVPDCEPNFIKVLNNHCKIFDSLSLDYQVNGDEFDVKNRHRRFGMSISESCDIKFKDGSDDAESPYC